MSATKPIPSPAAAAAILRKKESDAAKGQERDRLAAKQEAIKRITDLLLNANVSDRTSYPNFDIYNIPKLITSQSHHGLVYEAASHSRILCTFHANSVVYPVTTLEAIAAEFRVAGYMVDLRQNRDEDWSRHGCIEIGGLLSSDYIMWIHVPNDDIAEVAAETVVDVSVAKRTVDPAAVVAEPVSNSVLSQMWRFCSGSGAIASADATATAEIAPKL